jgi:serine/threonine-protein kinase
MNEELKLPVGNVVQSRSAEYVCLQPLGIGGTAETYLMLAKAGKFRGQLFAVKIFRRLSRPDWRDKFLDEATVLENCEHPAVMRVFDNGLYLNQHPFVVAEYLPKTFKSVLKGPTKSTATRLAYAVQLLSALEYLSQPEIQIVHRDIKPANVFIKGGSCVLGDFGLAKRLAVDRGLDLEMYKASIGARMPRNYRTPDLIEYLKGGASPTGKSDVYQLGLLFAEMFSGSKPQEPMSGNDFAEPIILRDFRTQDELEIPLKNLIMNMLIANAAERPAAAELVVLWTSLLIEVAKRSIAKKWLQDL